jgi:hypothetical protein
VVGDTERREPREVHCGNEQIEVGADFGVPADAGASPAVPVAHQLEVDGVTAGKWVISDASGTQNVLGVLGSASMFKGLTGHTNHGETYDVHSLTPAAATGAAYFNLNKPPASGASIGSFASAESGPCTGRKDSPFT